MEKQCRKFPVHQCMLSNTYVLCISMSSPQVLHANGCAPRLYCTFQNGICYEFIQGDALGTQDFQDPSLLRSGHSELMRPPRGFLLIYLEVVDHSHCTILYCAQSCFQVRLRVVSFFKPSRRDEKRTRQI